MKKTLLFSFLMISITGFSQHRYKTEFTTVNGKNIAYSANGLQNRKQGEPLVIFASGGVTTKENWDTLFNYLPANTAWITYDRPGIGQSQDDSTLRNGKDLVNHLHNFLQSIKAAPPYILVGHSYGGPLIRLYAGLYPSEVSGLVFIDPTDFLWTRQHEEQLKQISKDTVGWVTDDKKKFAVLIANDSLSSGYRAELKRMLSDMNTFFSDYRSLPSLTDIPVTVYIAYTPREFNKMRVNDFLKLVENNKRGSVICLARSPHFIHYRNPKLIANGIQDVLLYTFGSHPGS